MSRLKRVRAWFVRRREAMKALFWLLAGLIVGAAAALLLAPIEIKGELVSLAGAILGTLITVVGTYLVTTGEQASRDEQERRMLIQPLRQIATALRNLRRGPPASSGAMSRRTWMESNFRGMRIGWAVLEKARHRIVIIDPDVEEALTALDELHHENVARVVEGADIVRRSHDDAAGAEGLAALAEIALMPICAALCSLGVEDGFDTYLAR